MSERIRDLDKSVQDKINDCLETLREMEEIESHLQQSCGIEPHITALCSSHIDSWLQSWKRARERNLEFYTWGRALRMNDTLRGLAVLVKQAILGDNGIEPSVDKNSKLQDELDQLEKYVTKIRNKHRFLANQVRPKVL